MRGKILGELRTASTKGCLLACAILKTELRAQDKSWHAKLAQKKGKAGECEAELGTEDVVHLGEQDMRTNLKEVHAEAGQTHCERLFLTSCGCECYACVRCYLPLPAWSSALHRLQACGKCWSVWTS